jgi:hypothetical protein
MQNGQAKGAGNRNIMPLHISHGYHTEDVGLFPVALCAVWKGRSLVEAAGKNGLQRKSLGQLCCFGLLLGHHDFIPAHLPPPRGISGPRPGTVLKERWWRSRPMSTAADSCSRKHARTHAAGTDAAGAVLQHDSNANGTGGRVDAAQTQSRTFSPPPADTAPNWGAGAWPPAFSFILCADTTPS